jgi:cytochrome c peroxidase
VALTAQYFHNGAVDNLAEAVRVMAASQLNAVISNDTRLGQDVNWLPERRTIDVVKRRILSDQDIADIVEFLNALSSDSLKERIAAK